MSNAKPDAAELFSKPIIDEDMSLRMWDGTRVW